MPMPDGKTCAIAAAVTVGGVLAWSAFRASTASGMTQPQMQAQPEDDMMSFTSHTADGHPGIICERQDHHSGYFYTPHRYPRAVGGEITALIHKGFGPMRVPRDTPDAQWIINPPSEAMF
jgi:hypothetical protein